MAANVSTIGAHLETDERINFLGKVYGGVALQTFVAGMAAYVSMGFSFPIEHPWLMLFATIGSIFLVQAVSTKPALNLIALLLFASLTGASVAPLINLAIAVSPGSVTQAFLGSSAAFIGLTAYVFKSRRDFSYLGGMLFAVLIALIVVGLLNVFLINSPVLHLIGSVVGIVLFAAFILYDTSQILRDYSNDQWVTASLTLYLDFYLLFQNLLSFLMQSDD